MPRSKRMCLPGVLQHVLQRGNNRQTVFVDEQDYKTFLTVLGEALDQFEIQLHGYVLLPDHFHLMLTPETGFALSMAMQAVGRRYVAYFNGKYQRSGTLWDGRFKSTMVQSARYGLRCLQLLDTHPMRAGYATVPGDYRWSSYRRLALGERNDLIDPHPVYQDLGFNSAQAQRAYADYCLTEMPETLIADLMACTSSAVPLGDDFFKKSIERQLGVEFGYTRRGRPPKQKGFGVGLH